MAIALQGKFDTWQQSVVKLDDYCTQMYQTWFRVRVSIRVRFLVRVTWVRQRS